ncbi:hypothetical protein AB595_12900 [Massilia sp. WF1]|uniref:hypothetical protein n=1 Tax=unclassified Massilia TaxID=2609279 RepID=UPI00064B08FA|nr:MULTISPECIES: hypothetical protein [unclassified Massilia]ALK97466.1 hypothetical protein AM586_15770 [Massilia sp. WG5]KLU36648.1 hypothetical protein AB595_12900 [Massilia sp. WF1]
MPSNQEYKGKGMKGRNYDEMSGVGTSSAGKNGATGNLNDGGRDGGVGAPDLSDSGNLQSAKAGQPGGTPAQGDSWRGQANQQGGGMNQQSGNQQNQQNQQSGNLGNQQQGGKQQPGQKQSGNLGNKQSGQQGSQQQGQRQSGQGRLSQDDSSDDQL